MRKNNRSAEKQQRTAPAPGGWVRLLAILTVLATLATGGAAATTGWRGDGSGLFPNETMPTSWTIDSDLIWKTPLPDGMNCTPIIAQGRLFVTGEKAKLFCLSLVDGKILWERDNDLADLRTPEEQTYVDSHQEEARAAREELSRLEKIWTPQWNRTIVRWNDEEEVARMLKLRGEMLQALERYEKAARYTEPPTHPTSGYASASPVSDENFVYAAFGTGAVACYDMGGQARWRRIIEMPREVNNWGFSASPLLVDGKLIVHIYNMIALDPETGRELWRTEAEPGFGTAVATQVGGESVLVTPRGDVIRAADGAKMAEGLFDLPYSGLAVADGVAYGMDDAGAAAVRLLPGENGKIRTETLWSRPPYERRLDERHYASPLFYDGLFYTISRTKTLRAFDAKTGDIVYEKSPPLGGGTSFAAIQLIGENLLVAQDNGAMLVLRPGRQYEEVARSDLGDGFRSTPLAHGGRLYIHSLKDMYCIGRKIEGKSPGRMLIADNGGNKVCILSAEGEIEWSYQAQTAMDAWMLPSGNVLLSHRLGVQEVTPAKEIVWEYKTEPSNEIYSCQPLADGNALVGELGPCRLLEVDRQGRIVKEIKVETSAKGTHGQFRYVRKTRQGTYLVALTGENVVRELDASGKVVGSIQPPPGNVFAAVRLENGNTILPCGDGHRLVEVDAQGQTVWQIDENELPANPLRFVAGVQRLPNGNTLVCNWGGHGHLGEQAQVFEVTPEKKVVWQLFDYERFGAICGVQVLGLGQDVLKGEVAR